MSDSGSGGSRTSFWDTGQNESWIVGASCTTSILAFFNLIEMSIGVNGADMEFLLMVMTGLRALQCVVQRVRTDVEIDLAELG